MAFAAKCLCGAKLKAPEGSIGKRGKCPSCGASSPIVPWLMCSECGEDISLDAEARFACPCKKNKLSTPSFVGPPGCTWTNATGVVRYQMRSSLHEKCGPCFQVSGHIGNS